MDNEKNDTYYLKKIISDLMFVMEYTSGISQEQIENNPLLIDSIMFRIIQIAENNDKLSSDFKNNYSNVPWRSIKGMRNLIVHDYGTVDLSIVYDTVVKSIPEYHKILSEILK